MELFAWVRHKTAIKALFPHPWNAAALSPLKPGHGIKSLPHEASSSFKLRGWRRPWRTAATDFSGGECVLMKGRRGAVSPWCAAMLIPSTPPHWVRMGHVSYIWAGWIYVYQFAKCSAALCVTSPWTRAKRTVAVRTEVANPHAEAGLFTPFASGSELFASLQPISFSHDLWHPLWALNSEVI